MNKEPLTELERAGLEAHHLIIDGPSQLSDVFRAGIAWAMRHNGIDQLTQDLATAQAEIARLLSHIENIHHYNDECSEPSGYVEFQCDEALSQSSPSLALLLIGTVSEVLDEAVIEQCAFNRNSKVYLSAEKVK